MPIIKAFAGTLPMLGVCLGHQAMVEACDGRVVRAKRLMHGKTSSVQHDRRGLFEETAEPVRGRPLPLADRRARGTCLRNSNVTAWTAEGEVMGVRHRSLPMEGVQFHPESVLTPARAANARELPHAGALDVSAARPASARCAARTPGLAERRGL